MQLTEIAQNVNQLNTKKRREFDWFLMRLMHQFYRGVALRDPYLLLLDASVLMRLEEYRKDKFSPGLMAVLAFFNYLQNYSSFQGPPLIRSAVFYEFVRKRDTPSLSAHWTIFKDLIDTIETILGHRPRFTAGQENFEAFNQQVYALQHDEQVLKAYLNRLPDKNWTKLVDSLAPPSQESAPDGVYSIGGKASGRWIFKTTPVDVAYRLYEDSRRPRRATPKKLDQQPEMHHLDALCVGQCLQSHIASYISSNIKSNPVRWILTNQEDGKQYLLTKILYVNTNQQLKGVGDVDLLSAGNITTQNKDQGIATESYARIPLALDKTLDNALIDRADIWEVMMAMTGQEDWQTREAKLGMRDEKDRKQDESDERQDRCVHEQVLFHKDFALLLAM